MQLAPLPACARGAKLSLHRAQWTPPTVASSCRRIPRVSRATEEPSQGPGSSGGSGDLEAAFSAELKRRQSAQTQERTAPKAESAPAQDPFGSSASSSGSSFGGFNSGAPPPPRARAAPPPKVKLDGTQDQRQRSLDMSSEGLEGLFPRASQLLQLGGSVFLAFLPFMIVFSLVFTGIYMVFGDSFLHRGSRSLAPPPYVDPERLLSEPTVDPYIPFDNVLPNNNNAPDLM